MRQRNTETKVGLRMGQQLNGRKIEFQADISPDSQYRYWLTRRWDEGPYLLWVMLNPSTADATQDDPTIKRLVTFTEREGYNALCVVNLFAYRSPDPKALKEVDNPVGPSNNIKIRQCLGGAAEVVCAWGNHGSMLGRDVEVMDLLGHYFGESYALGFNLNGSPKHPLYVKGEAPLVPMGTSTQ